MTRGAGLVRRRASSQRLLLAAAVGVILPALVLMTLIRMHAAVAERAGVQHAFASIPASAKSVDMTYQYGTEWPTDVRRQIQQAEGTQVSTAFAGVATTLLKSQTSVQYNVVGAKESVYFWSADDVAANATLVSGSWPAAPAAGSAGAPFDAAVPAQTARANGWKVGDVVHTDPRIGTGAQAFRVSGIYTIPAPAASYWGLDQFHGRGEDIEDQPVYGPLVVDPAVTESAAMNIFLFNENVVPDFSAVQPAAAAGLSARLAGLDAWVQSIPTGDSDISATIDDQLGPLASGIDGDRAISARLILLPVIELALLAFTALVLTTRLLAEHRRETDGLLRARGASMLGMARIGLTEGVALGVPMAVVAPFAARALLLEFSDSGLSVVRHENVSITGDLWAVAFGGAFLAALMLAVAGIRSSASFTEAKRMRGRSSARTMIQKNGTDVMVAVLGVAALWELGQYGSGSAHSGSLGVPLIVAPSILLLAGSLLALRLLPLIIGVLDKAASRRRGAVSALAGWRVGRTARQYAAPMILLIMAVAVGVQAVVYVASADRSAADQAAFDTGADVRLSGAPAGQLDVSGEYATQPGTAGGFAAYRTQMSIGEHNTAVNVTVLGIDPKRSEGVVDLRPDLSSQTWPALAGGLATDGWDADGRAGGVIVPGTPSSLAVTVRFATDASPTNLTSLDVQATLTDAYGIGQTLDFGTVPPDGRDHVLTAVLPKRGGKIAYPVRIGAVALDYPTPACLPDPVTGVYTPQCRSDPSDPTYSASVAVAENVTVQVGSLTADGTPVALPSAVVPTETAPPPSAAPPAPGTTAPSATRITGVSGSTLLTLTENTGNDGSVIDHALALAPASGAPKVVPVVMSDSALTQLGLKVGSTVPVAGAGRSVTLRVVGSVAQMPGTDGGVAAVVPIGFLDTLPPSATITPGTVEWWAKAAPGTSPAALAAEISAAPSQGRPTVENRTADEAAIHQDPMRSGVQLTLIIAALAALLFILIGFAVNTVIAVRARATELALLHAMGLSKRRTATLLILEQALIVVLGAAAGGVLAVVTVRAVLPLTILTDTGAQPVPKPELLFDLPLLSAVGGAAMLFLLVTVGVVVAAQRREGLAKALRMGEDR